MSHGITHIPNNFSDFFLKIGAKSKYCLGSNHSKGMVGQLSIVYTRHRLQLYFSFPQIFLKVKLFLLLNPSTQPLLPENAVMFSFFTTYQHFDLIKAPLIGTFRNLHCIIHSTKRLSSSGNSFHFYRASCDQKFSSRLTHILQIVGTLLYVISRFRFDNTISFYH